MADTDWVTLAIGAANAYSAYRGSQAAQQAAQQQTDAGNASNALQYQMYQQNRADMAPWRQQGAAAVGRMGYLMGLNPQGQQIRAVGQQNSLGGQDSVLAHINPLEAQMLESHGGSGRYDPQTGGYHFDAGGLRGDEHAGNASGGFGGGGNGGGHNGGSITPAGDVDQNGLTRNQIGYGYRAGTGDIAGTRYGQDVSENQYGGWGGAKDIAMGFIGANPFMMGKGVYQNMQNNGNMNNIGSSSGNQGQNGFAGTSFPNRADGPIPNQGGNALGGNPWSPFGQQGQQGADAGAYDPSQGGMGGNMGRHFTMADFQQDPGYQFRIQQGQQALERSAAARGGLNSGAVGKALEQYGQNLGTQNYQQALANWTGQNQDIWNRYAALSGLGQSSANTTASVGMNYGNQAGNTLQGIGNVQAAGTIGSQNAWDNGMNNGLNQWMNYQQMQNQNQNQYGK